MSQNYDYFFAFWWGLTVLLSFIGYGRAFSVLAKCKNKEIEGWGMQSAIGMGVVVGIGGILLLFSLAVRPVLIALVVVGALVAAVFIVSDLTRKSFRLGLAAHKEDFVLWIIAIIFYAASVSWTGSIDATDDFQGYLTMPEKITQTGTLRDPFNIRRTFTLGGHVFVKALVQSQTSERTGHLPDMGIAKLMLFGLLLGATRGLQKTSPLLRFCFIAMILLFSVPRINTNSSLTGVCLLVPSLLLLNEYYSQSKSRLTMAVQIGLLIAGTITMRTFFVGPLAAACGLYAFWSFCTSKPLNFSFGILKLHALPWIIAAGLLLPWMILSYIDCQTPLWPLINGNVNLAFNNTGSKEGRVMDVFSASSFLLRPEVLVFIVFIALSTYFLRKSFVTASAIAALLASGYIAVKCSASLPRDVFRFAFPILFSEVIFLFCTLVKSVWFASEKSSSESDIDAVMANKLVVGSLLLVAFINFLPGVSQLSESVASLYSQVTNPGPFLPPAYQEEYRKLQNLVPVGVPILTAVDAPYLLNYARNPILGVDVIGGASPSPGLPVLKGPQELKKYLQKQNISYILAVNWDKGLVSLKRKTHEESNREWFVNEVHAPHALGFMDSIDWLEKNEKVVARGPNCRLIKLSPL